MLDPLGDETLMGFVCEAAGLAQAAAETGTVDKGVVGSVQLGHERIGEAAIVTGLDWVDEGKFSDLARPAT